MRHEWTELLRRAELAEFYADLVPATRCSGLDEMGRRCQASALPGLYWCYGCSGTKRDEALLQRGLERVSEARAILVEAAPQVATRLAHIALTGENRDAVKAAQSILDRVGVRAGVEITGVIEHEVTIAPLEVIRERLEMIERRKHALTVRSVEVPVPRDD